MKKRQISLRRKISDLIVLGCLLTQAGQAAQIATTIANGWKNASGSTTDEVLGGNWTAPFQSPLTVTVGLGIWTGSGDISSSASTVYPNRTFVDATTASGYIRNSSLTMFSSGINTVNNPLIVLEITKEGKMSYLGQDSGTIDTACLPSTTGSAGQVSCHPDTLTLTFRRPVKNPTLHIIGLGGNQYDTNGTSNGTGRPFRTNFWNELTIATPGVTLSKLVSNTQLAVTSTTIGVTDPATIGSPCTATTVTVGSTTTNALAGCGSVAIQGTGSTFTFNSTLRAYRLVGTGSIPNNFYSDVFSLAVSVSEDYGDAPTSYDGGVATSNVFGDLMLGSAITADAPNAISPAASPNAGSGAMGDSDDALTVTSSGLVNKVLTTGPFSITVPVTGASDAGRVCGWIDLNKNGTFDTTAEQACATFAANTGTQNITLTWSNITAPTTGTVTDPLYMRLRTAYGSTAGSNVVNLTPTGRFDSGETEDYRIPVVDPQIKKDGPAAVGSNGSLVYTLKVWNNGVATLSNSTVADTFPAGFVASNITCTATGTGANCGTYNTSGTSLTATGTVLPSGGITDSNSNPTTYLTYTITGTAPANGKLTNTATVTAPTTIEDVVPTNNTSSVDTRVVDATNDTAVNITDATVSTTVPVLGNDTNGGVAATASNSTVIINNNGGLTGLTVDANGNLIVPANAPGGSHTVTYNLCDKVVTTACDTATVVINVPVPPSADLSVSKAVSPARANAGSNVTFTVTLSNAGPSTATNTTVTDQLPSGYSYVSSTPSTGTYNPTTGAWTVPTLASGSSATLQVVATVNPSGTYTNTAQVTAAGQTDPDSTPNDGTGDDYAQIALTVNQPPVATNDSSNTPLNTPVTFNITVNDTDADGTINRATVDLDPSTGGIQNTITTAQGTFTVDSTGNLTFTPATGFSGIATIPYTVQDNDAATSNQATISVTVKPQANNDTNTTTVGTPVTTNVLSNDGGSLDKTSVLFVTPPTGGTISNGGKTLVVTGQGQYDVQSDGSIKFTPVTGYVGTATAVPYQVSDTSGQTATANLTITVNGVPLQCKTTVYGLFTNTISASSSGSIYALTSTGDLGTKITDLPAGAPNGSNAAAMAISPDGKTIYTAGGENQLRSYNVITGVWSALGSLPNPSNTRPLRMSTDKNGNVYISSSGVLWIYDGTTISAAKSLVFTDNTGLNPAPLLGTISGDFINDDVGNIYLIGGNTTNSYIDVFRIQNLSSTTPTMTFVERLTDSLWSSTKGAYTGLASVSEKNYAVTSSGHYVNLNFGTLSVEQVKDPITTTAGTTRYINDLATCYYPSLLPNISSTKAVVDTATSSTTVASPGDVLEYTIIITNTGNIAADGVTFQDAIPAGTTYVEDSTTTNGVATPDVDKAMPYTTKTSVKSTGAANGTNLVGTGTAQQVVIKFKVKVNAGVTSVSNTGTLGYNDNSDGNLTPKTTPTNTVIIGSSPSLSISKTATPYIRVNDPASNTSKEPLPTSAVQNITYTITVKNTGSSTVSSISVEDNLPTGLTYIANSAKVAYSTAANTYSSSRDISNTGTSTALQFSVENLNSSEPKQSAQITFDAMPTLAGNTKANAISNTATVSATSVSDQHSDPATTNIIYPKLGKTVQNITKTTAASNTGANGLPGDVLEYCLVYNNYGTVALPAFSIIDQLPGNTTAKTDGYGVTQGIQLIRGNSSAVTYTSATDDDAGSLTTSGGAYNQGTMTVNLGSVAAGETGKACFRVTIN